MSAHEQLSSPAAPEARFHLRVAEARDEAAVRTLVELGGMALASDWQQGTVAVDETTGAVVGYIRVQHTCKGPHVAPVAVHPTWQGCGVGRALMNHAFAQDGPLKLVSQGSAAGFYRALGCSEIDFDEISGDLEEDCQHCPDRATCQPVAFMFEKSSVDAFAAGYTHQEDASATAHAHQEDVAATARTRLADTTAVARTQLADAIEALNSACTACGACTPRCELLESSGWTIQSLCQEARTILDNAAGAGEDTSAQRRALGSGAFMPFVLSCEGCSRCTARCPEGLAMKTLWTPARQLARAAGFLDDETLSLVKVDCTWDTFSVFRAVQGIDYTDLPLLRVDPIDAEAASTSEPVSELLQAETLFLPGCSLSAYAPELTRSAFAWLTEYVGPSLLGTACCGSTLEFMGEVERADAWKQRVLTAARNQGVKRIVCVCPGCAAQLAPVAKRIASDVEFVSLARLLVDAGVRVDATIFDEQSAPVMVVDSCNDRTSIHGDAIRQLFEDVPSVLSPCRGADARCCGAGGGVNLFNKPLARERTQYMLALGKNMGAHTLVTACPTCAYTYAFERWESAAEGDAQWDTINSINYLEAVFDQCITWPDIFQSLDDMWHGEHAAWVAQRIGSAQPKE